VSLVVQNTSKIEKQASQKQKFEEISEMCQKYVQNGQSNSITYVQPGTEKLL